MENLIIIGSGCAGLTAAIYAARANLKPILFEGNLEKGGQLMLTTTVENFPGFPEGVQGPDLIENFHKQAEHFGTRFIQQSVSKIEKIDSKSIHHFKVHYNESDAEKEIEAKTIIISTGASAKWLDIPSEQKFKGRGITTCATCDCFFFRNKDVAVIGVGDSACEEALFLSRIGVKSITLIHRRDELRASKIMQDRIFNDPKIKVVWDSAIEEFYGDENILKGVKIKNLKDEKISNLKLDGVFLAVGHQPNTKFLKDFVEVDEKGYIKTDRRTRTNVPGVFACGDVQDAIYRQAITAAGTGCQSAMEAEKYIENMGQ